MSLHARKILPWMNLPDQLLKILSKIKIKVIIFLMSQRVLAVISAPMLTLSA